MAEKEDIYKKGYIDGMTAHAWTYRGTQYVGKSGLKSLKQAISEMEENYNYEPPQED